MAKVMIKIFVPALLKNGSIKIINTPLLSFSLKKFHTNTAIKLQTDKIRQGFKNLWQFNEVGCTFKNTTTNKNKGFLKNEIPSEKLGFGYFSKPFSTFGRSIERSIKSDEFLKLTEVDKRNWLFLNITKQFSSAGPFETKNKLVRLGSLKNRPLSSEVGRFTQNNQTNLVENSYISSSLQIKKRAVRKTRKPDEKQPGQFTVVSYATADEYNLESLVEGLIKQDLYVPNLVDNLDDVVHAVARYRVDSEPREIFFFREGSVVFWNVSDLECSNVLQFLREYEQNGYNDNKMIQNEAEHMNYSYSQAPGKQTHLSSKGEIVLSIDEPNEYDKYALSNAMSLSVKLGLWEAQLEKYIESIEYVTEDLKMGRKIKLSQEEVLRKHGELFALRHMINLSSDLLDIPDFYWDRENLETIYCQTCGYFSINRRTKVMNEKLNHCVELIELLASHLSDKHHVRLEWMIIVLIMVEVAFETLHYIERYYS